MITCTEMQGHLLLSKSFCPTSEKGLKEGTTLLPVDFLFFLSKPCFRDGLV